MRRRGERESAREKCWSSKCIFHSFFLSIAHHTYLYVVVYVRATPPNCEMSCDSSVERTYFLKFDRASTLTIWNDFVNQIFVCVFPFSKFEMKKSWWLKNEKKMPTKWNNNSNTQMRAWERATKRHNTIAIFCWPKQKPKKNRALLRMIRVIFQNKPTRSSAIPLICHCLAAPSENATIATATPTKPTANEYVHFMIRLARSIIVWNWYILYAHTMHVM